MRKVHYKVTIDVFTNEDDNAKGVKAVTQMAEGVTLMLSETHTGEIGTAKKSVNIQDIQLLGVEATDSR